MSNPELLPALKSVDHAQIHATAARIARELPPPELGTITLSRNPWAPFAERDQRAVSEPLTVAQAFAREGVDPDGNIPWVACINGEWISRAEWATRHITRDDVALLVALPQGGGKASRIIAGIVLIVIGVIGNYLGGWGSPFIQAGIGMIIGGIAYKKPPVYTPDTYASLANPSPTYNLQAQGNYARLGQSIPVRYGRTRFFPDFAAQPYGDYAGNEQYLYQLFCLGFGEFDIHQIYIEDQALTGTLGGDGYYSSNGVWRDITWQVVPPGEAVRLFPTRVLASDAVSGQELLTATPVGPFQIVDAEVSHIAVDVVCPKGLYYANDSGALDARSVTFEVWARPLVQSGAAWVPSGADVRIGLESISNATNTPQRRSYLYPVATGRYQVRMMRTDAKDGSTRAGHDLNWVGLRGFAPGVQTYGNLTLLAMRMRATDQLSSSSSRKINVDATRKLREWSPATGWSAPVATRSIAAAFLDACTNDEYGLGISDARLPLGDLHDLETVWDWADAAEGCAFDYGFDRRVTAAEALTHIAAAGDCVWYQQGGLVRIRRQQAAGMPVQLFNMRNIRRGSLNITWRMASTDQPDCLDVWYWDEVTNRQEVVRVVLPGGTETKPQRVDLTGVQRRAQAWRIGMRMLLSARWHRIQGSFDTELEGLLSSPGDAVAIAHDMIDRAVSAELVSHSGTGKASGDVLTLSEAVEFADTGASYYVEFSTVQGGYSGPWRVTAGAQADQVVLAEPVADAAYAPQVGGGMERTRVNFGAGAKLALKAVLVAPVTIRGSRVTLNWYLDDARAWDLAGGSVPGRSQPFDLSLVTRPVLVGLNVVWSGTLAAPTLDLSWEPSPGALRYFIEISDDNSSWTRLPDATGTTVRITVPLRQVWLRVAAVGSLRGEWVVWSGNPATMQAIPANVTGLVLRNPSGSATVFNDLTAQFKWNAAARADGYAVEVWADGVLRGTYATVDAQFDYSAERNRADGGLRRNFDLRVRGVNGAGVSAAAAVLAVSNPQEAAPTVQAVQAGENLLLTVTASGAPDHDATEFWVSQAASINPATDAVSAVTTGVSATIKAPAVGTWRVWAAHRDKFGRDSLNLSPAYTINILDPARGVPTVLDVSMITAATGSPPPGGDAYYSVYDLGTKKMYAWRADLSPARYTSAVSADDIAGQIAQAQISADVRWTANQLLVGPGNLVVDDGFYDSRWWSGGWVAGGNAAWPATWVPQDGDGATQPKRFLYLGAGGGLIGLAGKQVAAVPGESYRVRLRIYRSHDFVGRVFAGMHIPMIAWAMPGPVLFSAWDGGMPHLSNLEGLGSWQTYSGIWTMASNQSYVQTRIDAEITAGYCAIYLECVLAVGSSLVVDGAVTASKVDAAYTNTTVLQARQATIDYASINSLSALSAWLGTIVGGIIEFTRAGWNYIRTNSKWWGDGVNGWIMASNPTTGDHFQEFRAAHGPALIEQRMGVGPNVGNASYYRRVRGPDGVDRVIEDPANGVFKYRGRIEADEGYFSGLHTGTLSGVNGTFSGALTGTDVVVTGNLTADAITSRARAYDTSYQDLSASLSTGAVLTVLSAGQTLPTDQFPGWVRLRGFLDFGMKAGDLYNGTIAFSVVSNGVVLAQIHLTQDDANGSKPYASSSWGPVSLLEITPGFQGDTVIHWYRLVINSEELLFSGGWRDMLWQCSSSYMDNYFLAVWGRLAVVEFPKR